MPYMFRYPMVALPVKILTYETIAYVYGWESL